MAVAERADKAESDTLFAAPRSNPQELMAIEAFRERLDQPPFQALVLRPRATHNTEVPPKRVIRALQSMT